MSENNHIRVPQFHAVGRAKIATTPEQKWAPMARASAPQGASQARPLSQMSVRTVPIIPREFRSLPQVALVSTGCAIHRYPRVRRGASAYLPQISFALVWIQDSLVRSGEPNHGCDGRVWGEECREHYQTRFREGFGADCRRCGTQN